jgi:hypothetical protein
MSSLFRNAPAGRARGASAAIGLAVAAACCNANAADVYYQPIVSLASAYNTNVELDPLIKQSAVGYFADAATNIGIATPQSETILQPRLLYNYYPSASQLNRLEGFMNLNSRYSWQRDRFTITGFFDHRDDVNAEQPGADFNPVNPGVGNTNPGSGRAEAGVVRNWLILDPTYSHLITPLSSVGVGAEYQRMNYSPDDSAHVDFNYYMGKVFYAKTIDMRTDFSIAAFGSKYNAGTIDSTSNSGGVQFTGGYNWSSTIESTLSVSYQRIKFEETDPRVLDQTSNAWGASFSTVYKAIAGDYRLTVGRSIAPSSLGGLYTTDQVRGQYDRDFTQRLRFTAAGRVFRDRTTSGVINDNARNYAAASIRLQYMLTPRLFMAGAYTYLYQKYTSDPTSADANVVQIQFGYKGLDRQR